MTNPLEALWKALEPKSHLLVQSKTDSKIEKAIRTGNPKKLRKLLEPGYIVLDKSAVTPLHTWIALNLEEAQPNPNDQKIRLEILNILLEARQWHPIYDPEFYKGTTLLAACEKQSTPQILRIAAQMKTENIGAPNELEEIAFQATITKNQQLSRALLQTGLLPKPTLQHLLWATEKMLKNKHPMENPMENPRENPQENSLETPIEQTKPTPTHTPKKTPSQTQKTPAKPVSFSPFQFGVYADRIPYVKTGQFFLRGSPKTEEGWKIHASATPENAPHVLGTLLPVLNQENICHKFIDLKKFSEKKETDNTYDKLITIYPKNKEEAAYILKKLDNTLKKTDIQGARWKKNPENRWGESGLLSYRYGGFTKDTITLPSGEIVPDDRSKANQVPDTLKPLLNKSEPKPPEME